jgi:peptide deformylase
MLKLHAEPFELLHKPVQDFDFNIHDPVKIEQEMIAIMKEFDGIGLAANQVGLDAKIFVMGSERINGFCKPQAFINPVITKYSIDTTADKEGCLSFPTLFLNVKRPSMIEATFYDTSGNLNEISVTGYMAKCFQHEYDHLNGICYTNRVSRLKLDMAMNKLLKKQKV